MLDAGGSVTSSEQSQSSEVITASAKDDKFNMKAGLFLSAVAGVATIAGFGTTLAATKNKDADHFAKGLSGGAADMHEAGTALAFRALRWGTMYAVTGCGVFFWVVWKLSGANNMVEFRQKIGSLLPRIPKNDPPQGRTEFENLTDLLKYISEGGHSVKHSSEDK